MEKNKLALMYMDMRQDADIRNDLCRKYRIDPKALKKKKTKLQRDVDKVLEQAAKAAEKVEITRSPDVASHSRVQSASSSNAASETRMSRTTTIREGHSNREQSGRDFKENTMLSDKKLTNTRPSSVEGPQGSKRRDSTAK